LILDKGAKKKKAHWTKASSINVAGKTVYLYAED
jgi:hypothetical protein